MDEQSDYVNHVHSYNEGPKRVTAGLKQPERVAGPALIVRKGDAGYEGTDDSIIVGRSNYPGDLLGSHPPRVGNLAVQVGGDHYRRYKIQPVEYAIANGMGPLAFNIVKYATRYKDKGGKEDIKKLIHYAKLILEFEYGEV